MVCDVELLGANLGILVSTVLRITTPTSNTHSIHFTSPCSWIVVNTTNQYFYFLFRVEGDISYRPDYTPGLFGGLALTFLHGALNESAAMGKQKFAALSVLVVVGTLALLYWFKALTILNYQFMAGESFCRCACTNILTTFANHALAVWSCEEMLGLILTGLAGYLHVQFADEEERKLFLLEKLVFESKDKVTNPAK
jgi:hypothetical protein